MVYQHVVSLKEIPRCQAMRSFAQQHGDGRVFSMAMEAVAMCRSCLARNGWNPLWNPMKSPFLLVKIPWNHHFWLGKQRFSKHDATDGELPVGEHLRIDPRLDVRQEAHSHLNTRAHTHNYIYIQYICAHVDRLDEIRLDYIDEIRLDQKWSDEMRLDYTDQTALN